VLQAIQQLQYVPNAMARGLQTRQSRSLAVMIPEIGSSGAAQILQGAEDVARQSDFTVLLMNTAADSARELECLSIMHQRHVDGIIWVASTYTAAHRHWLQRHTMPIVVIAQDFSAHGLHSVLVDNYRAAYDATCYLISQKHQRIGMITGNPHDRAVGRERLRGFKTALRAGGIALDSRLVTNGDVSLQSSGYEAMAQLIAHHPTAVLAASDIIAMGAMQFILGQGLSIPGDISIMGFDDLDIASHPALRLSTVAFNFTELGAVATRTLLSTLAGEKPNSPVTTLPHRLVIRDTVSPP
jgi:LacI family transcriptional regulator